MAKPAITKRVTKGSALTYSELDTNFQNLADATVSVADGTNTAVLDLNDTLNVVGSGGATVSVNPTTKTLTVSTADTVNAFQTIAVSGQSSVVADATNDTLTLVAGSNVTITTDAATDTITINSTASGSGTVNSGAAGMLAYYPSTGTTLDDVGNIKYSAHPVVSGGQELRVDGEPAQLWIRAGGYGGTAENILVLGYSQNSRFIGDGVSIEPGSGRTSASLSVEGNIAIGVSGGTSARLSTRTAQDLVLNTNLGTNSASITIADGTSGNITIAPAPTGTGKIVLSPNTNNQAWIDSGTANLRIQCGSNEFNAEYGQGLNISSGLGINLNLGSSNKLTVGSSNQNVAITSNGTGTMKLTVADNGAFRPAITLGNASSDDVTLYTSGGSVVVDAPELIASTISSKTSETLLLTTNLGASSGTISIGAGANQDIQIYPNGTGVVKIGSNLDLNGNEITNSVGGNITIATPGAGNIYLDANTADVVVTGELDLPSGVVKTTTTNGHIEITANGTGLVRVGSDLDVQTGIIGTSTTNSGIEIEVNGTGVLYLNGPLKTNATTGTPVDDTTPVSWLEVDVGGTLYFMPLYQ